MFWDLDCVTLHVVLTWFASLQTIWRHDREVMWLRPRFLVPQILSIYSFQKRVCKVKFVPSQGNFKNANRNYLYFDFQKQKNMRHVLLKWKERSSSSKQC